MRITIFMASSKLLSAGIYDDKISLEELNKMNK